MKLLTAICLSLLAVGCQSAPVMLTCDRCPGAASYTVYVVTSGTTNTTTFTTNVFNVIPPPGGYAAVTQTDTNGFESEWSNCLTNSATKPTNLRKK